MKDVRKLNPKYIRSDGYYFDMENPQSFFLTREEIKAARIYFNDPNIAGRIIVDSDVKNNDGQSVRKREVVSATTGRPYKLTREQPGKSIKPGRKRRIRWKRFIIMGLIVFVAIEGFILASKEMGHTGPSEDTTEPYASVELDDRYSGREQLSQTGEVTDDNVVIIEDETDMVSQIRGYVFKYAEVYHLDGQMAFDNLSKITNGFTSEDFLVNLTCDKLSCKGNTIFAESYEELVIYYMRIVSQDPGRYGLSKNDLVDNVNYQSGTDYASMITHYCEVMHEDPCLIYAIVQAETGWKSQALLELHNPCGLMDGGSLWKFDTFESGLIETIAQVRKYRLSGAHTIAEIGAIHCPVGVENDPTGLNRNWINNVTDIYNKVYNNQEQYFGQVIVNNGLKMG